MYVKYKSQSMITLSYIKVTYYKGNQKVARKKGSSAQDDRGTGTKKAES